MGDITRSAAELADPTATAELTYEKTPETTSVSAKLPEKNASDLLPLAAMMACCAGPTATFGFALTTATPWWVAAPLGLAQLVAVIIVYTRARPSTR